MTHFLELVDRLRAVLGDHGVLTGSAVLECATQDWSKTAAAVPLGVMRPRTPQQVAEALSICDAYGMPIAVQGGLTGLAGGANPQPNEMVLSLGRLDQIEDIDSAGGTAIVQAGVTLERVQTAVAAQGWYFPLDLGARGSCQVGGNAATNAGGNRVLRFGTMRNLVLGLEVALPDGTLLTMLDRVIKNNAGFDLKHFFIGTEGTLGVITRLSLALVPKPMYHATAFCGVNTFSDALALLREAKSFLPGLSAFELMWQDFFGAATACVQRPAPLGKSYPLYVLIEGFASSPETGNAGLEQLLSDSIDSGRIADAVVAHSLAQCADLWAFRESVGELLSKLSPFAAFDVSVATPRMDLLVTELRETLSRTFPEQQHLFFGHLADGNLHVMSGAFGSSGDLDQAERLVYEAVGRFGGSISAEHGIGTVKKPFLHHSRTGAEIDLMRQIKGLFDPHGILNRGRIFA